MCEFDAKDTAQAILGKTQTLAGHIDSRTHKRALKRQADTLLNIDVPCVLIRAAALCKRNPCNENTVCAACCTSYGSYVLAALAISPALEMPQNVGFRQ